MCTAVSFRTDNHYFGRNLDLERDYGEVITITPRHFPFEFRNHKRLDNHFAIIGTATVVSNYPLYFDGTNEHGLSMAGLNFPENARYNGIDNKKDNIAPFELIPWILAQCRNVCDAENLIKNLNITDIDFSTGLPSTPLHWLISDKEKSLTVESVKSGLKIYENPVGILTNNPTFDFHMMNLNNYINISPSQPENRFSEKLRLTPYSLGMGAMGLPGDFSSASRFVRAAFTKFNSASSLNKNESVSQFFHILEAVTQPDGCNRVGDGSYEYTRYSSCCNTDKGIYYYRTYFNSQISAVDMNKENLNADRLITYDMIKSQQIKYQN